MEPKPRFTTTTYNIDEDGVIIDDAQMHNYFVTIKHKPTYEKHGNNVRIIRCRTVRKSGQQQIEFPTGDGRISNPGKSV